MASTDIPRDLLGDPIPPPRQARPRRTAASPPTPPPPRRVEPTARPPEQPRSWPTCFPSGKAFGYSLLSFAILVVALVWNARLTVISDFDLSPLDARTYRLLCALVVAGTTAWFACSWIDALNGMLSRHSKRTPTGTFHRRLTAYPARAAAVSLPLIYLIVLGASVYFSAAPLMPQAAAAVVERYNELVLKKAPVKVPKKKATETDPLRQLFDWLAPPR